MHINEQQEQIIKLLKSYVPQTLAHLARNLDIGKSSIDFQLGQLEKMGIVIRKKESTKKIFYTLADEKTIKYLIDRDRFELEKLLTNDTIEGLDAYLDLLNLVAAGEGEIIGYANLEEKITDELMPHLEKFRDKLCADKRMDYFTVTDSTANIDLLRDHFRKKIWKKYLVGRIIPSEEFNVNCDIYTWDNTAGICSFEDNGLKVTVYTDRATVQLIRGLLRRLFDSAMTEEEYVRKNDKLQSPSSK